MTRRATLKSSMEGPKWARFDIYLRDLCFQADCELVFLERDTTWLREHIRYKIDGPEDKVRRICEIMNEAIMDWNNPIDAMK